MKIGILGAGQLARMLALAGYPLGLEFVFLDPSADACATPLGRHLHGDYANPRLLAELADSADIVTYEFENVPARVADYLSNRTRVHPSPDALAVAQDRLLEKNFFRSLGIRTPAYEAADDPSALERAMTFIGYPAILKSRTQGYDGKGQSLLTTAADLPAAWRKLDGVPAIVEARVPFDREVSIIGVRNTKGDTAFYPLSENLHRGGILRVARNCTDDPLQAPAEEYCRRLLEKLRYVGVLALELFDMGGQLIANEFAPRVHNSGHWTIEGAATSQFENHLRAVLGWPLGKTSARGHSAMVNFIGGLPRPETLAELDHVHLHWYHKASRKGRKVAHATVCADNLGDLAGRLEKVLHLAGQTDDS